MLQILCLSRYACLAARLCRRTITVTAFVIFPLAGALSPATLLAAETGPQTLVGATALFSPQAEVMLQFEKAMIEVSIEAAGAYTTPGKLENLRLMMKDMGEAGYKKFQAEMKNLPRGDVRRAQIEKIVVNGARAVLTARSGPNEVDEIPLLLTPSGWKVSLRSE